MAFEAAWGPDGALCVARTRVPENVTLGLSQHVSGLGVTLFVSSFSYYVFRLAVPVAGTPPTITPFTP